MNYTMLGKKLKKKKDLKPSLIKKKTTSTQYHGKNQNWWELLW